MNKQYICECGKIFTNPQSFNGHKSHCKEHLGEEKYNKNLKANTNRILAGCKKRSSDLIKEKQEKHRQWISEQHKCEKCGKIMTEKYGSGRFCSKSCANSRQQSEETKEKIRFKIVHKTSYYCSICGKQLKHKTKTGFCKNCLDNSEIGKQYRSNISKDVQKKLIVDGKHKGWQSRNIISYPEQFWMKVLDDNNINYQHNFPVKKANNINNYFLDFYIEVNDVRIDLEIDGKQHNQEDRKASDKIRDEYLASKGYLIYRIKWNEINSDTGKELMQHKIQQFEQYYNVLDKK